jgi:hypothetical protein
MVREKSRIKPRSERDRGTNPLQSSLDRLEYISLKLRQFGMFTFLSTLIYILIVLFLTLGIKYTYSLLIRSGGLFITLATLNLLLSLSCVVMYESLRRRGDTLFEEISDELQWKIGREARNEKVANESPPLNARVVLRTFARTTDLPLVPGKFGPAVYAGINVLLTLYLISTLFARL